MRIIPPVLFLTFAGFLPNDCDAMYRLEVMGKPTLYPEDSGKIVVTTQEDVKFKSDLMMDAEGRTEPYFFNVRQVDDFARYRACFVTHPNLLHKSSDLYSAEGWRQSYNEQTYKPKSVEVIALNIEYDEFEQNWHEYDMTNRPPNPQSKEYARLYITIPNTNKVLHKLFKERRALPGVNYDSVRHEALLKIHDRVKAQITKLEALPSSTWQ